MDNSFHEKERWKEKILQNFKALVHNTDVYESVDDCFSEGIFTEEDKENVDSRHTKYEKNREFLKILLHKSESNFNQFLDCLSGSKNWIKILITETKSPESRTEQDYREANVRRKIFRNFAKILSTTRLKPLIDDFITEGIFGIEDYETITTKTRSTAEENKRLLNILLHKNTRGYALLISKLGEMGHSDLVEEIQGTDVIEDVDGDIEKHLRFQEDCRSSVPLNIQEQNEEFAQKWEKEDKVFIETRGTKKVMSLIGNNNIVTVTGNAGTGKSAILYHVALQFKKKGYETLLVQSPEEVKSYLHPKMKQVFVVDDPIGVHSLDKRMFNSWIKYNDSLVCLFKNEVKFLCSIRTQVRNDPDFTKRTCILNTNVVNLQDGDCELNKKEKVSMLEKHFELNGCDENILKQINMDETHEYFPLICRLFTTSKDFQKYGTDFFVRPFRVVLENLDLLKSEDEAKYCTLVMCFVYENNLDPLKLRQSRGSDKSTAEYFMEACGVSRPKFLGALNGNLASLSAVFLKEQDKTYQFIHDLIYDVIAYHFGQEHPEDMLKFGPSRCISERVVVNERYKGKDPYIIVLDSEYFPVLLERLLTDLEHGKYYEVMTNDCWDDDQFMEVFNMDFVRNQTKYMNLFHNQINYKPEVEEKIRADIEHVRKRDITQLWSWFYIAAEILHIPGISLTHWTVTYAHKRLFDLIWEHLSPEDMGTVNTRVPLLHYACLGGDISICTTVLEDANCDVNAPFVDERSLLGNEYVSKYCPLHLAAMKSLDVTSLILSHGANINLAVGKGRENDSTALTYAAGFGNAETVSFLLKSGAAITANTLRGAAQNNHAHVIQLLLDHHISIDMQDNDGWTALMDAANNSHGGIVKLLLRHGATVDIQKSKGWTALMLVSRYGFYEIAQSLLSRGAGVDIQEDEGWTALILASQGGYSEIVQLLLRYGASVDKQENEGWTALMMSSKYGYKAVVQLLLSHGASVDTQNNKGLTALIMASRHGYREIVQLLLKHDAGVDIQENDGWTSLMMASQHGKTDVVQLLLSDNASIDVQNNEGRTTLMETAIWGHAEIVNALLSLNASVDMQDNTGMTTLMFASLYGQVEIVQLLLEHKANIDMHDVKGWTALMFASQYGQTEIVQLLLDHNAIVDMPDVKGWTALMLASQYGQTEIVKLLLSDAASTDMHNNEGRTCLMLASSYGHTEIIELIILLCPDVNVDYQDNGGWTALMMASRNGHTDVVQLLLGQGGNIDMRDNEGKTALTHASTADNYSVVKLLLAHKANIYQSDNSGHTALWHAEKFGSIMSIHLLRDQIDTDLKTIIYYFNESNSVRKDF